ncbi:MAG: putative copper-transporting ATPase PacS, partial [Pseudomonadota bacterium]
MNHVAVVDQSRPDRTGVEASFLSSPSLLRGALEVRDDFAVLDDPVEQREFTHPLETAQGVACAQSVLMVQGMYCAACADTIEDVLAAQPGVLKAEVHAATRRLTLHWHPNQTQLSGLAHTLGQVGYRMLPGQQARGLSERLTEGRRVLWRLAVAGLCMMQVMMYAWPAYITEPGEIPADLQRLLNWASWVLSWPVLLFACGSFFSGAWRDLKLRRIGMDTPVTIGIVVTFIVSSLATFDPTGPWGHEVWYDSLTMFVFFLMGGRYLEFKARDRTAGALDALMNRLPEVCERRLPEGGFEQVSVRRLRVGDTVRVQAGQAFPADGKLAQGVATVDEALLTGESHPQQRHIGEEVIAGSFNLAGPVEVCVTKVGRDTRFSQIVALMEQAATEKPRLALFADRIAGPFLSFVLLAALLGGWWWWHIDPHRALAVAVSVLIVTCPCALSLATPAAMLASAGALAQRGILLRRLQALESLAQVNTVVFDKTGTLTHDRITLAQIRVRDGLSPREALNLATALAQHSLHPLSKAIVQARHAQFRAEPVQVEPPMLHAIEERAGQGLRGMHEQRGEIRLGSATFCGVQAMDGTPASTDDLLAPQAHLSDAQGWVASLVFDEGIRPDAAQAVQSLHKLKRKTWLLSGDRLAAAQRVADAVGIKTVVAGASPEEKLFQLSRLQAQQQRVAMVGDGLNDGPVLARADASFALGTAAPLAQAQSDVLIQSGHLNDVVLTLQQAQRTMQVVRQN